MKSRTGSSPESRVADLDLHGIVGVRLAGATTKDAEAVARQLGFPQGRLGREPDIVVRFEDDLSPPAMTYLGVHTCGYTSEDFYLLDPYSGQAQARIPFDEIGGRCEIVCRRGSGSVPLLLEIVNLCFLSKQYVPLHASAFLFGPAGVLVAGWAKGGKTGVLLSFVHHGAQYVGDEWVVLSSDGTQMLGLPVPLAISEWQFEHIPGLLPRPRAKERFLFAGIHLLDAVARQLGRLKIQPLLNVLERAMPMLKGQLKTTVIPRSAFRDRFHGTSARPDRLFLTASHSAPDVTVERCDPAILAEQMAHVNEYEQQAFFGLYRAYQFAFPGRRNAFLEKAGAMQRALIQQAFKGKQAYRVLHPYPVALETLFERMRPFCERGSD